MQHCIGRDSRDLAPDIARQTEPLIDGVFETGQAVIDAEIRACVPSNDAGRRVWLSSYAPIYAAGGTVEAVQCVMSDITDRVQAEHARRRREHRFRVMADTIPEIIFTNKVDGFCDYQNARFYQITGMAPGTAQGWRWMDALHPEDARRCRQQWTESVRTGEPYDCHYRLQLADGEYRWFMARSCPARNRQGNITQWFGAATDIHDLVLAEQALSEAREAADVANRAKSEFLANMSHEVRTPLTAIIGFLDVLLLHTRESDDLQSLPIIKRNADYLLELVSDILDLSKIEAHKLKLEKERYSLEQLVSDVHESMQGCAIEKGLALLVGYDGLVPESLFSDRTRMRQILLNLISNAIKFTDRGEVRLVIRFLSAEIDPRLQLQVIDTGIGIAPQQLGVLFEPFTQIDGAARRHQGGSGLGLTITRRIVEMLGGQIAVDSRPGEGSTFTLTIPIGPVPELTLVEGDKLVSSAVARLRDPQSLQLECRVLVVDDRRDIRLLISQFLGEAGAEVATAEDGQKAIAVIDNAQTEGRPFDLIVMDIQMPVMDGYAATAELRRQGFKRPIIALTASVMKAERNACYEAGFNAFLSKPIKQSELVAVVARYSRGDNHQGSTTELPLLQKGQTGRGKETLDSKNPLRILVVDDHKDAASATGALLELAGYRVQVALDGASALNCARMFRPDIALLDLGLPDMHGHDLLKALKAQGLAKTRFIALSGRGEPADEAQALVAGFDHYLVKPLDPQRLKSLLCSCDPCLS